MLKKVRIQNFKCYSKPVDFELSFVNFIYGNNSVGKSTFLQAIHKTCQAFGADDRSGLLRDMESSFKGQGITDADIWKIRICKPDATGMQTMTLRKRNASSVTWDWIVDGEEAKRPDAFEIGSLLSMADHEEAQTGSSGSKLMDIAEDPLTQSQIDWINDQFAYMKLGYRCIDATSLHDSDVDYGPIALPDVGAGIRGLFRYLKALSRWTGGILLLEEPESHVNEDQLAAWTRIIVRKTMQLKHEGADAQICVECHSEHMLLMLLTEMVRGIDGLSIADVSVYYVKKTQEGSAVYKCSVDKDGEFDEWPSDTGFFKARNRILFGAIE